MSENKEFVSFIAEKLVFVNKENDYEKKIDFMIEIFQYILQNIEITRQYPDFYIIIKNKLIEMINDPIVLQYPNKLKILQNIYNKIFKRNYIGADQTKYVSKQIQEHLIPDLSNIITDYLDDDRCSMLTEEGDRCAYKNEYIKVVDGIKYEENCKAYCRNHYTESFKRIKETSPEIVNLKGNEFDQDYLINEWFVISYDEAISNRNFTSLKEWDPILEYKLYITIFGVINNETLPKDENVKVSFPDYSDFNLEDLIEPSNKQIPTKRWISSSKWKYDPEFQIVYLKYVLSKT